MSEAHQVVVREDKTNVGRLADMSNGEGMRATGLAAGN